ncbi:MAG: XRE family transcriptional regulator [Pseudomonadota bacterium]
MLNLELLKTTMSSLGLSQTALADRCVVSREAVSNWLSGESIPRPSKLKILAEVLGLDVPSLFGNEQMLAEPVVAYRTQKNTAATDEAMEAANELARHLRELVPFVRGELLFTPPSLETPSVDEIYIRKVAQQTRMRIGLTPNAPLTREQLLDLHHSFGSILVPVLWTGEKQGHENALSVYLPESKMSWVIFSLNARNDDFNYWLAHELAHCYSLHTLQGDDGELFAERFAQELLFPRDAAIEALDSIVNSQSPLEHAKFIADAFDISVVTVIRQTDRLALEVGRHPTGLETSAFWEEWNANRELVPTVAYSLFGPQSLDTSDYIENSEKAFKTPIFKALAKWQASEGGRSPSFIASALNIDLGQALELSHALSKY